ncbi:uncharacterized transporter Sly41p [[Candida] anglica]|uniref:Uncharacterized transporter Sly41p n=1 Tax=[Candida] anglica TaxID=148631 RepID=A0ABP0EEQ2_9ASCO
MYLSSQANPNSSSTNLHQIKNNHHDDTSSHYKPRSIHHPKINRPTMISSPSFGNFSGFQLPLTPPVSNRGSPVKERDSYGFGAKPTPLSTTTTTSSTSSWLPPIDARIVSLCLGWYFCSAVSNNSTKSILKQFSHPVTLTEVQFLLNCVFCLVGLKLYLSYKSKYATSSWLPHGFAPQEICSIKQFITPTSLIIRTTLPMGMFQFVGHLSSHKATSLIPVSMVHTVKALAPITTVLTYRCLFQVKYKLITYVTLIPLIVGIMLACYKPKRTANSSEYYKTGLVYAFVSMLIFVSQNIFAKKILTCIEKTIELPTINPFVHAESSQKKLDKLTILYYCSLIGFMFTLPFYLFSEFKNDSISLSQMNFSIFGIMIINGLSHFLQSLLAFQILGSISPVNYSIANIMKRIIVIVVAILWEGQRVTSLQGYGLILTMIGLYCYDRWGTTHK